ncbi:helix-turn-helix domain-containing protein [Mycolicibacterium hodleri]|uniref:helix-turn-helix domain-containing protein n=1 Tax=Mycolicibacterium hodleri TaxID=49897 RepID=UPI0021F37D82|nr:helix-turn-helix domain-containing protein [Mycolicibacterium hodleri]
MGRGGTSASFFHDHLAIAGKFLDRSFLNDYSQIVGRLRRFDEASAVDAAAAVFRRRGYTAASVDDLVEATGVHRGSLYNAFGSKHGLFLRALDAAAAPDADPDERLDLLMVALLELAAVDARVRDHVSNIISEKDVTAGQLGKRLLSRAEVDDEGEPE